jgi:phage terminase small subunit
VATELTYKQRRFVAYYLGECNGNALESARRAGYRSPHPEGARLLQNATIRAAIDAKLASVAMPADEILARMSDTAGADMEDFVTVKKSGAWDVDLRRAKRLGKMHVIKKIKATVRGVELELRDSHAAQVKLGEYHGLWRARSELDINAALDEALDDSSAKAGDDPAQVP